jgi:hypothetical protein
MSNLTVLLTETLQTATKITRIYCRQVAQTKDPQLLKHLPTTMADATYLTEVALCRSHGIANTTPRTKLALPPICN